MPNTKTNRDGLLVTENVRIFLMKTDGNGPGAAGKESVMNLLGMRSLGKIKEKGEKIMFWIELVIMLLLIFWGVRKGGVFLTLAGAVGAFVFTFIFKSPMSDPRSRFCELFWPWLLRVARCRLRVVLSTWWLLRRRS